MWGFFSEKEKLKAEKDKIATKKDLSDLDVRFSEFFKSSELTLSILYSKDNKVLLRKHMAIVINLDLNL